MAVRNSTNNLDTNDGNVLETSIQALNSLDPNSYATKKSYSHVLLNVSLITANATQLYHVLNLGKSYQFYTLLLTLIISSVVIQFIQGVICGYLGSRVDINSVSHHYRAKRGVNICVMLNVLTIIINIIIGAFDITPKTSI